MVMTRAFHAGSTGSNPVRGTADQDVDSAWYCGVDVSSSAHTSPTPRTKRLQTLRASRLALYWVIVLLCLALVALAPHRAHAAPATTKTTATWYGPGFYGHTFACGGVYREATSRGVAHMTLDCGTKLVVCSGVSGIRRCVWVEVIDTGAFDPANFDLTARTARDLLGCRNCRPSTMRVSWRLR